MITERTALYNLEPGNIFLAENGTITYRVIKNTGDWILLEKLIPVHEFTWWEIAKEKNIYIEVIKNKPEIIKYV